MNGGNGSRVRRRQGEGSIYHGGDGRSHAAFSVGRDQRDRRRRRHAQGATVEEVEAKLAVLQAEADHPPITVGEWSTWWLDMVGRTLKQSTARTYGTNLRYLHPLADLRLDRLTPEHLERVYVDLASRGVGTETIQGVHRCVCSCLAEAVRRQKLERNPALVARPHRIDHHEIQPLSLAEAQAILKVAAGQRNALRWEIALALGLCQGEALGLQWADIDLQLGTLQVRRALQRGTWHHGCPPQPSLRAEALPVPSPAGRRPDRGVAQVRGQPSDRRSSGTHPRWVRTTSPTADPRTSSRRSLLAAGPSGRRIELRDRMGLHHRDGQPDRPGSGLEGLESAARRCRRARRPASRCPP